MINCLIIGFFAFFGLVPTGIDQPKVEAQYAMIFQDSANAPDVEVFIKAIGGYEALKAKGKATKDVIAIIDFTKASTEKRLWVVDLEENKVLYHTLVAHGKNSGENYAKQFSNKPQSYKSSIGFYQTKGTYQGKHGLSLRLEGLEQGINDKAFERAIVMHGASYVSESFIRKVGRLGRSHGCPAVPQEVHKEVIETLKNGACLFIWYPDPNYIAKSKLLKPSLL